MVAYNANSQTMSRIGVLERTITSFGFVPKESALRTSSSAQSGSQECANYIVERFAVSRHQAKRLIEQFGSDKRELDLLLSGTSSASRSRRIDQKLTLAEVTFGRVC
jgi:hypothetical protein